MMLRFRNGEVAILPVEASIAMNGLREPSAKAWIRSPVGLISLPKHLRSENNLFLGG